MTKKKEKSAAVLTILSASEMTPKGRKAIAAWLVQSAKSLIKHGDNYANKFTARYLYK